MVLDGNEKTALNLKQTILNHIPDSRVAICTTVEEAKRKAMAGSYQILVLEVMPPDGAGIEFAKWVRRIPRYENVWIVMAAEPKGFTLESIREVHYFDYIPKPYMETEVVAALNKLIELNITGAEPKDSISIKSGSTEYRVRTSDIVYVEVNQKTTQIHTADSVYAVKRYPLQKILEQLPSSRFMQCHRSYLINTGKIIRIEKAGREMYLRMGGIRASIPVGTNYREAVASVMS